MRSRQERPHDGGWADAVPGVVRPRSAGAGGIRASQRTQLDDFSAGIAGNSRFHHRVLEVAIAAMVQETAQMRLERALASKTRLAIQQLELEPGQLVDFWRKPATKDESGWRGPATVLSVGDPSGDSSPAVIQWQGSKLSVRTQDFRKSLVYLSAIMLPTAA